MSDTIIHQLGRVDANINKCVGQGHDGASVVSGHLNGVQKKIPQKTGAEVAYYVHCFCHRLNLVSFVRYLLITKHILNKTKFVFDILQKQQMI